MQLPPRHAPKAFNDNNDNHHTHLNNAVRILFNTNLKTIKKIGHETHKDGRCLSVGLTRVPPLWAPSFLAPEGNMQASKWRKQQTALLSYDSYEPERCSSCAHILEVPNFFLIECKIHSTGRNLCWYWKPSQLPKASGVMDLSGESTITMY